MELLFVISIVSAAVFFTVRGFVRIYRGEVSCGCASGCSCASKEGCSKGPEPFKTL